MIKKSESENTISYSLLSLICGLMVVTLMGGSRLFPLTKAYAGKPITRVVRKLSVEQFPYSSLRFDTLITDSQQTCGVNAEYSFRKWLDEAYRRSPSRFPGKEKMSLEQLISVKRRQLDRTKDPWLKAHTEIALSQWLHGMIKNVIPRFSLDRGFEFCNVIKYGERQCFLQSVLITGLLQDMGVDAGVAMVYQNERGEESNNGHAITLVKLPIGQDIIVDASEPYPFASHRGLFIRNGSYRYVQPIYVTNSHRISGYRASANGKVIPPSHTRTMDYNFVRSQFFYYRGERAQGGLLSNHQTPEGLASAASALRLSVGYCSRNPLAVYMLGRVYWAEGKHDQARAYFERAARLYTRFGWFPGGPREYLQLARKAAKQSTAISAQKT